MITVYFFHLSLNSSHVYPLQVENCDSNSRLVADEYDNGKFRLEKVKVGIVRCRRLKGNFIISVGIAFCQSQQEVYNIYSFEN